MQKNPFKFGMAFLCPPPKLLRVMKLTFAIITTLLIQVSASTFGQKITINEKNISLEKTIRELRKQTGFDFIVDSEILHQGQKINLSLYSVSLDDALRESLKNLNVNYSIEGKSVVITKKKQGLLGQLIDRFTDIDVSGKIIDDKGISLPGATVRIKGTNRSVITDESGSFRFANLQGSEVLIISYVGYQQTEFPLSSENDRAFNNLTIKLLPLSGELQEVKVINTGYQQLSKEKSTGAIVTLNAEDLEKRNAVNILDNLEGTVPGLIRYRGNTSIRGQGTIRAGTGVLIVVDGFPMEGSIADLNPYDIESINVLKDAAAAAIYGARATNGVIVVTTKKATQRNKTNIEFSANLNIFDKPDYSYNNFLTPSQQVDWESNYFKWYFGGGGGTIANPISAFETTALNVGQPVTPIQYAYYQRAKNPALYSQAQLDETLNQYRQNDLSEEYRKHVLKNQILQQYNLAIRTNSGRSQNSLVLNYTGDNSGMINSYNKQLNIFYKGTYAIGNWLDLNYGVNTILEYARTPSGTFATDPFAAFSPYISMFNADGSRAYYSTGSYNQYWNAEKIEKDPNLKSLKFNHLDELERDYTKSNTFNSRYYLGMNLKVLPGLNINPTFQYEDNKRDSETYSAPEGYAMRVLLNEYTVPRTLANGSIIYENLVPLGAKISNSTIRTPSYTARGQVNYNKDFEKHGIVAIAGTEFRQTLSFGRNNVQYGFNDQLQSVNNVIDFRTFALSPIRPYWRNQYTAQALQTSGISREVKHRFASVYANATYTYDRKYNVFGSIRKDYADIFGSDEEYRGRPLWSVGGNWLVSNEEFIKTVPFLDYLKVRISYGITGNVDLSASSVLIVQSTTNTDTQQGAGTIPNPPNDQLRWERTATTNIGVDFNFFKNRLRGTFDWYNKSGSDILAQKRLDPSEGWTTLNMNNAKMVNNGIEISLGYDWFTPKRNRDFAWSSNLVVTQNKGLVTQVDGNIGTVTAIANGQGFLVGYAPNSIFSLPFAGMDPVGLPQWYNAAGQRTSNNLLTTVDNLVYSGVTNPTLTFGLNNEVSYKGFSLNVFAVYYGGHVIRATPSINPLYLQMPLPLSTPSFLADAWTPQNPNTVVAGAGEYYRFLGVGQTQYPISDFRIRPADFIKIRNVVLGYTLPQELVRKIRASAIRLRFQLNNPQTVWMKQKDIRIDTETGGAPAITSYVFGFNINF